MCFHVRPHPPPVPEWLSMSCPPRNVRRQESSFWVCEERKQTFKKVRESSGQVCRSTWRSQQTLAGAQEGSHWRSCCPEDEDLTDVRAEVHPELGSSLGEEPSAFGSPGHRLSKLEAPAVRSVTSELRRPLRVEANGKPAHRAPPPTRQLAGPGAGTAAAAVPAKTGKAARRRCWSPIFLDAGSTGHRELAVKTHQMLPLRQMVLQHFASTNMLPKTGNGIRS